MNVWPVIVRELRAESRRPFNYWLRVLGPAALMGVAATMDLRHLNLSEQGLRLSVALNNVLLLAVFLLVPVATADCISRERREGTLGLLFLTPLRAYEIVVAKSLVQAMRAASVCWAALPVLVLPLLMGGVAWAQVAVFALFVAGAFSLALAAGILASSFTRTLHWGLLLAFVLAAVMAWGFATLIGASAAKVIRPYAARAGGFLASSLFDQASLGVEVLVSPVVAQNLGPKPADWLIAFATDASICGLCLLGVISLAAVHLRRSWQAKPPTEWQRRARQKLCTPLPWIRWYRPWLRRKLERNPIGWLEQRTWQGRSVLSIWTLVMISWWIEILKDPHFSVGGFGEEERLIGFALLFSMAATGAVSFWRDRDTGTLDLVRITRLDERRIVWDRLRSIWSRYALSFLLFLGIWLVSTSSEVPWHEGVRWSSLYLALPPIGLFFALRCRNIVWSLALTWAMGYALPKAIAALVDLLWARELILPKLALTALLVGAVVLSWKRGQLGWTAVAALLLIGWLVKALLPELKMIVAPLASLPFEGVRFFLGALQKSNSWYQRAALSPPVQTYLVSAIQLLVAFFLAWRLHRNLASRERSWLRE